MTHKREVKIKNGNLIESQNIHPELQDSELLQNQDCIILFTKLKKKQI